MADDVIREPHSVRRATGPLFVDSPRPVRTIDPESPVDAQLGRINPSEVHAFSDAELNALLAVATVNTRRFNIPLVEALRLEIVTRIIQRHGVLQPDEESA